MTRALTPAAWMADALCTEIGGEIFFPEPGAKDVARAAKRACQSCPVIAECLEHALTHDERHGVWGGMGEVQRRRLHAERQAGECAA